MIMARIVRSWWGWLVIGLVSTGAVLYSSPAVAEEQGPGPSGAEIDAGGVQQQPSPVVLPNTGGGPVDEGNTWALTAMAAAAAAGSGAFLHGRLSRRRLPDRHSGRHPVTSADPTNSAASPRFVP
jgi:hypothetical protein